MLRGVTKFIDCEEQIISTAIRLETIKKPRDFVGESLTAAPYATFEISSGFAEGQMDILNGQVDKSSNGDCGQFECGSKILDSVNCPFCKAAWEWFAQFELIPFVNAIRIRLNKNRAWCSLEINPSAPLKVGKFFLCPLEPEP